MNVLPTPAAPGDQVLAQRDGVEDAMELCFFDEQVGEGGGDGVGFGV